MKKEKTDKLFELNLKLFKFKLCDNGKDRIYTATYKPYGYKLICISFGKYRMVWSKL